jgi:hypothetical protein
LQILIGGSNSSVVQPVDSWLKGLCSSPSCSNNTLSAVVTNITAGCPSLLSAAGSSNTDTSAIIQIVQEAYPTVRQVFCLSDSGTNCVTQTLTNIQNVVGTLTLSNILSLAVNPAGINLPSNVTCTDCIKEAYNIIEENYPSLLSGEQSTLQSTCGSSFTGE